MRGFTDVHGCVEDSLFTLVAASVLLSRLKTPRVERCIGMERLNPFERTRLTIECPICKKRFCLNRDEIIGKLELVGWCNAHGRRFQRPKLICPYSKDHYLVFPDWMHRLRIERYIPTLTDTICTMGYDNIQDYMRFIEFDPKTIIFDSQPSLYLHEFIMFYKDDVRYPSYPKSWTQLLKDIKCVDSNEYAIHKFVNHDRTHKFKEDQYGNIKNRLY